MCPLKIYFEDFTINIYIYICDDDECSVRHTDMDIFYSTQGLLIIDDRRRFLIT